MKGVPGSERGSRGQALGLGLAGEQHGRAASLRRGRDLIPHTRSIQHPHPHSIPSILSSTQPHLMLRGLRPCATHHSSIQRNPTRPVLHTTMGPNPASMSLCSILLPCGLPQLPRQLRSRIPPLAFARQLPQSLLPSLTTRVARSAQRRRRRRSSAHHSKRWIAPRGLQQRSWAQRRRLMFRLPQSGVEKGG